MQKFILQQPANLPEGRSAAIWETPTFWLGAMGLIFLVALAAFQNKSQGLGKNVLGAASFAKNHEKYQAKKLAYKQIKNEKHNEITLWINTPKKISGREIKQDKGTIYLPDQTRSTLVIGGSGTGKTYSVVKPTLRAAVCQGMPIILYDADYPGLAKSVAPLAASAGYDVEIFAPGHPESRVCNILDFLEGPEDASNAAQLAKTLLKNFSLNGKNDDVFFQEAGEQAATGAMQLAKALPIADLLSAYAVIKDERLMDRLPGVKKISPWLELAFGQLMSTKQSEKTVDSIRGTASLVFGRLSTKEILTSITGRSTMSQELSGKKLLIFGVKQDIRLVVAPLLATVINILITKNVRHGRTEPVFVSLDELPTIYLPNIVEWLAENRKYGQCTMVGCQTYFQLVKTYGKEMADTILSNTATKFLFNPQSIDSAKLFSSMLGDVDVSYKTKSRTWGKSTSTSDHRGVRPLVRPEEFQQFGEGTCIMLNPGYKKDRKHYIPVKFDPIEITLFEKNIEAASARAWDGFLKKQIEKGIGAAEVGTEDINQRIKDFQEALPVVEEQSKDSFVKSLL